MLEWRHGGCCCLVFSSGLQIRQRCTLAAEPICENDNWKQCTTVAADWLTGVPSTYTPGSRRAISAIMLRFNSLTAAGSLSGVDCERIAASISKH